MADQLEGMSWELANPYGLAINEAENVWHSGHITDVLELDDGASGLLAATETGGVWTISTNGMTVPLSNHWETPDINCLAFGPDGDRHVYAGCDGGVIMETDVTKPVPFLNWRPVDAPLPEGAGNVNRILVLHGHRRIVAVCNGGVYWSDIPKALHSRRGCLGIFFPFPTSKPKPVPYAWKRAEEESPRPDGYFGAAVGSASGRTERPGEEHLRYVTIVAGGNNNGIFVGRWDAKDVLTMRRSLAFDDQGRDMTPWYFGLLGATSVASCEVRPNRLYAVSANPDGTLRFVFRSTDGGQRWTPCGDDLRGSAAGMRASAGDQGNRWNNCIAVMPSAPGVVAVGWKYGTFLSPNEGGTWMQIYGSPHLHADVHVVKFQPTTTANEHFLYIGSDGGLAQVNTDDVLADISPPGGRSEYNRLLPTHQCYATLVARQFYGTLAASSSGDGLVSTGVHDNGNLAALTGAAATPWVQMAGGDGGWNGIVADGGLVHNIMGEPAQAHRRQGASFLSLGVPPITLPPTAGGGGFVSPIGATVQRPSFRNSAGETIQAVGGSGFGAAGQRCQIYGLFASGGNPVPYHWELLGSLAPDVSITSVASLTGATVFVGAADSRIFAFDSAQGTAIETPVAVPKPYPNAVRKGGAVTRIVATPDGSAFAILNGVAFEPPPMAFNPQPTVQANYVLRLDGLKWVATPWTAFGAVVEATDEALFGLDVVTATRPHAVFVSTDNQVYGSLDDGNTWKLASNGLPRRAHNAELRYGPGTGREPGWLYLSTFGRSVWRANMGRFRG